MHRLITSLVLTLLIVTCGGAVAAENEAAMPARWGIWNEPASSHPRPQAAAEQPIPADPTDTRQQSAALPAGERPSLHENTATLPAPLSGQDYLLGPGDILDISVWKDEALTKTVVVLPDGRISFPLAGEMSAAGLTVAQLKDELAGRLARYVPDMVLSVEVKQSNSMLVYVIGRVNSPGRLVLNTNINVLQALAMAGGLNPFASKDKIKLFRKEGEETRIIPFRYSKVVEGDSLEENVELKRGDVIVVP